MTYRVRNVGWAVENDVEIFLGEEDYDFRNHMLDIWRNLE
jgi:hypothetical protein